MWRIVAGVTIGGLLFFPGIVLLQWLAVDVLGLYDKMTLTDGALVVIIMLQCVLIVQLASRGVATRTAHHPARMTMVSERGEERSVSPQRGHPKAPPRPSRRGYDRDL